MNSRDFEQNSGFHQDQSSSKENGHFGDRREDFSDNDYSGAGDLDPRNYPQGFMPMQGPNGMFYPPYMNPYMPYVRSTYTQS